MNAETKNTVLGVAPMALTLPVVGAVLVGLFVLMKPEATSGLAFHERVLFWTAHIGLGLVAIAAASRLLRPRWLPRLPLFAALLLIGLAGAAALAPAYVLIEAYLPAADPGEADDWLDLFALRGPLQAVLAEFVEVTPVFLTAWFAVNLPLLLARPELTGGGPPERGPPGDGRSGNREGEGTAVGAGSAREAFLARLPRAIGREVIVVSSDMHYLHVHTTLGKCMILGALRDAAASLDEDGMLVHRSHWVAHAHVIKLVRQGSGWACVMSNERRVPVSRRNRAKVTEWYGRSANVVAIPARKAGS